MPRKLYPSEARKIRAMLDEGFTDFEVARALHVAQSSVSNLRKDRYNNSLETKIESSNEPEINKEDQVENDSIENIEIDSVENEEPDQLNFIGGRRCESEKPDKKEIGEDEFDYECIECGFEFNEEDYSELPTYCPECGIEFDYG